MNFLKNEKDGCAKPKSKCRQKFCAAVCLGRSVPEKDSPEYKLCQHYCDPQEMTTFTRKDRTFFMNRFEDKNLRRKHELNTYIAGLLSKLPWCEGECDYDESSPNSCDSRHIKAENHWSVCAENCFFIKDIREHANQCVARLHMAPRTKYRRPPPTPPIRPRDPITRSTLRVA